MARSRGALMVARRAFRDPPTEAYPPIGDYAAIGDCRSAALISRDGSLDWLCWPRFDSPSLFAALLDSDKGGRFAIRPVGSFSSERRYVGDTNIQIGRASCRERV